MRLPAAHSPLLNGRPHAAADPPARPAGAPWSLRDAAAYLGVSERHLASCVADGRVRSIRLGARRLIPDAELQRVAREGELPPADRQPEK